MIFEAWKYITRQWFGNLVLVVVDEVDGTMYWVRQCLPSPIHVSPEPQDGTKFGNRIFVDVLG